MCNYYRQVKVLHGKNKAETLLQDFVVSTGKCKFRLFCCRTQLLVFQTSVFLRTLCVFRDQLILFGVYCCAFVDFFSQYCCPVNFKTAEKSTPKPFSIGLRAFFFRKKAPRKTNNDGRIRRIGAGQETNGVAQSALSKEGECPFLVEEKRPLLLLLSVPTPRDGSPWCKCLQMGRDSVFGACSNSRDKAKSRWFSKSKSVCAGGSGQYLDFALYGRRSAAG